MEHYFTIPINENGLITDQNASTSIALALAKPFNFTDVYIYSHGWWTNASRAVSDYNRFSIEFAHMVRTLSGAAAAADVGSLAIGIHWPSMLSEDQNSIANWFQGLSYYTMEKRADTVGEHGVYAILRMITAAPKGRNRITFLGHSFGCKVVCAALQEILDWKKNKPEERMVDALKHTQLNLVLLQAATDNNDLEEGDVYGDIAGGLKSVRVLVTTSQRDKALHEWYPKAQDLNIFRDKKSRTALGAGGPTGKVATSFGGKKDLVVNPGFKPADFPVADKKRLFVTDLTPVHDAIDPQAHPEDGFGGRHSDIFLPEVYALIAGFLFGGAQE